MGSQRVGHNWATKLAYMYGWVPLLLTWNYHNVINRLYPNKIKSLKLGGKKGENKWINKLQKKKRSCCFPSDSFSTALDYLERALSPLPSPPPFLVILQDLVHTPTPWGSFLLFSDLGHVPSSAISLPPTFSFALVVCIIIRTKEFMFVILCFSLFLK